MLSMADCDTFGTGNVEPLSDNAAIQGDGVEDDDEDDDSDEVMERY
jgi:hypothetical protein